jgi:hypothetical protein
MSDPNLIVSPPPFDFDSEDPSGGWGLAMLIVALIAAVAVSIWLRLSL